MKNLYMKFTLSVLMLTAALILPTSCIPEEESQIDGKGPNGFRLPVADNFALIAYNAAVETRPILDVLRDVNSNAELNRSAEISFALDQATLDLYNEEHETHFEMLPAENYELNTTSGSIKFEPGDFAKSINLELNPEGLDFSKQYALPFLFSNPESGYNLPEGNNYAVIQITVKNLYDGKFAYSGSLGRFAADGSPLNDGLDGPVIPNVTLDLSTAGQHAVDFTPRWASGVSSVGGIGAPRILIDPATNAITLIPVGATVANWGPIPGMPNDWNPATKTFRINWKWGAAAASATGTQRAINVTLVYDGPR